MQPTSRFARRRLRRLGLGLIATALAGLSPGAAAAQPAPTGWVLDDDAVSCSLSRSWGGDRPATLVVKTYPGSNLYDLLVAGSAWPAAALAGTRPAKLALLPSGAQYDRIGRVAELLKVRQRVIAFGELPPAFLSELAAADRFTVSRSGTTLAAFPIPGAAAAVRALGACEDETLRAWGADPAGLLPGATRAKPIGTPDSWLHSVKVMITPHRPMDLQLRLVIGKDGKTEKCEIIRAPVRTAFDTLICLFLEARYAPARDPAGRPVRSVAVFHAHWD